MDLEPAHDPEGTPPVDGVPCCGVAEDCTSTPCRLRGGGGCHLPRLLSWLARYSRDERPDGSLLAFAWGDIPLKGQPLSHPLPMGVRFLRPPLPVALSAALAVRFPWWEHDGLTKFRLNNRMG